jgi:hypothetical protein
MMAGSEYSTSNQCPLWVIRFTPKADIHRRCRIVRFVPIAGIVARIERAQLTALASSTLNLRPECVHE